jgi:hypothetical protein
MDEPTYADHGKHGRWEKVGRCIYCPCGMRLYQGSPPDTEAEQVEFGEVMDYIFEAARKRISER